MKLRNIFLFCLTLIIIAAMPVSDNRAVAQDINSKITSGEYVQKVNNFIVILDASGSGNDIVRGEKKLETAKNIISRLNKTIPDSFNLICAFRTYGKGEKLSSKTKTELIYGPAEYSKSKFEEAVETVIKAGGLTFMGAAIDAASQDMESFSGKTAVILISDGKIHTTDPIPAADKIKQKYGDNLYIHTIFISSDTKDIHQVARDKGLLENIARRVNGYSVTADDVASDEGMNDFVEKIFLEQAPEETVKKDTDQDGVYDDQDDCPDTLKGVTVNEKGCWIVENLLFEFNKWNIDPQYNTNLDDVVKVLKENENLKIEIQGHTDDVGTEEYNQRLSEKRAVEVMKYFLKKGIDKNRLSSKGYGLTKPVSSNDTLEDRAKNRRVELHPVY